MSLDDVMNQWWGMEGGMINPFDKDGNLLPQFQQREPMEDDSMFQGRDRNQLDDWVENERRTTNPFYHLQGGDYDWEGLVGRVGASPFYHLRGGADGDDELARRMAEFLAPHISQGVGQVADGIQDFFKSPEQREQEKRDKAELEEAERKKKERESGSWSSFLTPFFGNGGGAKPILPPQDALESKKENPMVEEVIEEPMDDGDIRAYFPNAKIIRYSSLAKLGNIEQLLPRDKSYAFLLYEDSPGSGHWIVLLRYGTTIEFFCSYGSGIDAPLRWYNPKDNAMLGQSKPYLSLLLKKAGKRFKAIHNAVPFQSKKQGVATCGAWDVMRVNQLVNHNQDLHEFQDYMEQMKKETGLTYDEIVVNYVSKR